jgi:poly(A) polymerase
MSSARADISDLPPSAAPAVRIVRRLREAGHEALLAGGCVRDLLLGCDPKDYDVATDAPPDEVCNLFRATRKVGAQFGVVLVRRAGRWVEVATFRRDAEYRDGRRPERVTFTDAREDALRRDFTINGMFLDPIECRVIDYVGGREDLEARLIRAIGDPAARFGEDYLRMLRAVRFAARFGFALESGTLAAIREHAKNLLRMAAERRRDELERMLADPSRADALRLLRETTLITRLWSDPDWREEHLDRAARLIERLPEHASFEATLAILLADRDREQVVRVTRELACSNEQRETIRWLVKHHAALDDPNAPMLAQLKRLMAHPAFVSLRLIAEARCRDFADAGDRQRVLAQRLESIPSEAVQPPPLVTGADLAGRGVEPGQVYAEVLDELYTRQLNEELTTRNEALAALEVLLRGAEGTSRP